MDEVMYNISGWLPKQLCGHPKLCLGKRVVQEHSGGRPGDCHLISSLICICVTEVVITIRE